MLATQTVFNTTFCIMQHPLFGIICPFYDCGHSPFYETSCTPIPLNSAFWSVMERREDIEISLGRSRKESFNSFAFNENMLSCELTTISRDYDI